MLEQIKAAAQVQITHVPYKGGGQQMNDALGGQFEVLSTNAGPAVHAAHPGGQAQARWPWAPRAAGHAARRAHAGRAGPCLRQPVIAVWRLRASQTPSARAAAPQRRDEQGAGLPDIRAQARCHRQRAHGRHARPNSPARSRWSRRTTRASSNGAPAPAVKGLIVISHGTALHRNGLCHAGAGAGAPWLPGGQRRACRRHLAGPVDARHAGALLCRAATPGLARHRHRARRPVMEQPHWPRVPTGVR
jgi:hypothetical protein